MLLDELLAMFKSERSLKSLARLIAGCEPLAWMSAASILKGSNRGFDWAIHGDDSQRVTESVVEVVCESAEMRILTTATVRSRMASAFLATIQALSCLLSVHLQSLDQSQGIASLFRRGGPARSPHLTG